MGPHRGAGERSGVRFDKATTDERDAVIMGTATAFPFVGETRVKGTALPAVPCLGGGTLTDVLINSPKVGLTGAGLDRRASRT